MRSLFNFGICKGMWGAVSRGFPTDDDDTNHPVARAFRKNPGRSGYLRHG